MFLEFFLQEKSPWVEGSIESYAWSLDHLVMRLFEPLATEGIRLDSQ